MNLSNREFNYLVVSAVRYALIESPIRPGIIISYFISYKSYRVKKHWYCNTLRCNANVTFVTYSFFSVTL